MPATQIESTAKTFDEALNLFDFEALAHQRMSPLAWEYITSAAADEITVRWNRAAFDRIRLKPKTLVDVSKLNTRVTLFGRELPFSEASLQRFLDTLQRAGIEAQCLRQSSESLAV